MRRAYRRTSAVRRRLPRDPRQDAVGTRQYAVVEGQHSSYLVLGQEFLERRVVVGTQFRESAPEPASVVAVRIVDPHGGDLLRRGWSGGPRHRRDGRATPTPARRGDYTA